MLAKPFTFLLVFLLTIINFIVLLIPISIIFFPLFMLFKSLFIQVGPNLVFFLVSRISGLIIAYVLLDTMFGFTVRRMRKGCIPFKKATAVYGHQDILDSFEWLKQKFKKKNVKLYLEKNSHTVNAYAVGSFAGSSVTITAGLINKMQEKSANYDEFLGAIRAILAHEMSHLTNQDFLPGLLTSASETASRYISKIIRWFFIIISMVLRIVPWFGKPLSRLIISLYNLVNFVIMAFFNLIFMPLYSFMMKFFGRSIEYRCDRQSAYAYGGKNMANALSFLGAGGYFSLFSTHPGTKSRIKYVQEIKPREGVIRPGVINMLTNFLSLVLVVFICLYSTRFANVPDIYNSYMQQVYYPIKYKTDVIKYEVMRIYSGK